jgi:23S rRNA pseudouridine1911/1915/1917 synthase
MALSILYEDFHLIVVNKPPALLTQAPKEIPSLEGEVKAYIKEKYQKPAGVYLGVPHRLDRPVSGVVLFARNTKAASRVAEQFQKHQIQKVYWGLVEGIVESDSGTWHDWLRKIPEESRTECVESTTPDAKEAITQYRVLKRDEGVTLLELTPQTGRMHQLRIATASRGYPIVGDTLYGSKRDFGPPAELPRDRIIALHARQLTITHPFRKEVLTFEAPLPELWYSIMELPKVDDDATQ